MSLYDNIYDADFKLQQMERKVARGLGERSSEEKETLKTEIEELTKIENDANEKVKELESQYNLVMNEVNEAEKRIAQMHRNNDDLSSKIAEIELEITSCEATLDKLSNDKDDNMVKFDLVRLEVRRLRDVLNTLVNELCELDSISQDIDHERRDKRHALGIEIEIKTAQARVAEEERHKCAIEAGQRSIAAEKMKAKYEMILNAQNGGEENPVIAAAKKRADLQLEGDNLNRVVIEKEKEITSMETKLFELQERNTTYRLSFAKVDKNSKEYKEVVTLQKNLEDSEKLLLQLKLKAQVDQRNLSTLSRKLETVKEDQTNLKSENKELNWKFTKVDKDLKALKAEENSLLSELREQR